MNKVIEVCRILQYVDRLYFKNQVQCVTEFQCPITEGTCLETY